MILTLFGIRHHGPGCARSLRAALEALAPDVIALEGPADGQDALAPGIVAGLKPPVAMLLYSPEEPAEAVYFPLAEFSPEWQALQYAGRHNTPLRLMDLPQSICLPLAAERRQKENDSAAAAPQDDSPLAAGSPSDRPATGSPKPSPAAGGRAGADGQAQEDSPAAAGGDSAADGQPAAADQSWRIDPIALLAEAAGFKDHELWWEQQIEQRIDARDLFAAIQEAMATVRAEYPHTPRYDMLREAHMRRVIRGLIQEGFANIAVICGAWHVPVLDEAAIGGQRDRLTAKEDEALLKGLPKHKTTATWIPWTYSRLTYASGYGAGIRSPGWYGHLWASQDRAALRWIATAARLLREKDLDASSASVIEAVRLSETLASLRELRAPGLAELNEAILSVLCRGDNAPLRLIRDRLEIGDRLGEVPADVPAVPLAQDLARWQKSLRLKPAAESKLLDLDLRGEIDLARSHMLHRLTLLGIPWGQLQKVGSRTSTFHEIWLLQWQPEFAVAVIEAGVWGTTLVAAGTAKALSDSADYDLQHITKVFDQVILSGLEAAIDPLLARIQARAAVAADVRHLMDALAPLARVARYGDVRGTQAAQVEPILVGMFERAVVGLPSACAALDEEAAARMLLSLDGVSQALEILSRDDLSSEWLATLQSLIRGPVHPLLRGACCRRLLEQGALDPAELYRQARLELAPANPTEAPAAWATGLLRGSGLLLLHQDDLWRVFDRWLEELPSDVFTEMLPLLRRAFSGFSSVELRQMGDKVKRLAHAARPGPAGGPAATLAVGIDPVRARLPLPVLARILGVKLNG